MLSPEIESSNLAPSPFVSPGLNHLQIMARIRSMLIGTIGDRLCLITWKGKFLYKWERRCTLRPRDERLGSRMMCICIYGNAELIKLLNSGDFFVINLHIFCSKNGETLMKFFRYKLIRPCCKVTDGFKLYERWEFIFSRQRFYSPAILLIESEM